MAAAKGLAYARELPLVPVNHLEGHVAAAYLADPELEPPFVALIASGGHTSLYTVDADRKMHLLGETLDDAAGEALDKGARMLGLGFPGGPAISSAASDGDRDRHDFPVGLRDRDNLDFSFSGLKTSLLYKLKAMDREQLQQELPHLAAGYEAAVVEALSRKLLRAADLHDAPAVVVAGGVAANASLRRTLEKECASIGYQAHRPPTRPVHGQRRHDRGRRAPLDGYRLPGIPVPERPQRVRARCLRQLVSTALARLVSTRRA